MRIVIKLDTSDQERTTTRTATAATDVGGPPRELVAAVKPAPGTAAARPLDAGGPPAHLLARLGDPASSDNHPA